MTYEELRAHFITGGTAYITCQIDGWDYAMSNRRHGSNRQAAWFICQGKLVFCCHGGPGNSIQVRNQTLTDVRYLERKLGHLARAKYNSTIYLSCCYGADKITSLDGVQIVPVSPCHYVSQSIHSPIEGMGFYCDRLGDFDYFYQNVVKAFTGRYEAFLYPSDIGERGADYALAVTTRLAQPLN